MSYFLRIKKYKKGKYLSIVDSKHVPGFKQNQSKVVKTLGYENKLITDEIQDPITYYRNYCKELNNKRKSEKNKNREKISNEIEIKNLGYFLPKLVFDKLNIKPEFKAFESINSTYECDIYHIFSDLIFARIVQPESKCKTYEDIISSLYGTKIDYSKDDMYNALTFLGENYEMIIPFLTYHVNNLVKYKTNYTLFDCTNFYFEIDKTDDLRKKGPSKEHRNDPIIGMGLLLDANALPITMKIFPGNESEINKLPETILKMKKENHIKGRTIQIADKELNCGKNIAKALLNKDGYLFSKSVLKSKNVEKKRYELDNERINVNDENGNIAFSYKDFVGEFEYEYTDDKGQNQKITVKEKRIVTFNPKLQKKKLYELNKIESNVIELIESKAKKERFGPYGEYINLKAFDKDGELIEAKIKGLLNREKIENEKKFAGFNVLVTSETKIDSIEIYKLYHHLWRIEHTFRIMKSDLLARPVFLRKEATIKGHFLIVYCAVLLIRILENKYLKGDLNSNDIFNFIRNFNIFEMPNGDYTNFLIPKYSITAILDKIPEIEYKYLKKSEIDRLLNI